MSTDEMSFDPQSLAFLESQYLAYCEDPESVDPAWRDHFQKQEKNGSTARPQLGPSFSPASIFNPVAAAPNTAAGSTAPSIGLGTKQVPNPEKRKAYIPRLRTMELFRNLPEPLLNLVADAVNEAFFDENGVLFRRGDPGDALYIITKGRVRIERNGNLIAQINEGAVVGELSLMSRRARSADVIADCATSALVLKTADFDALLSRDANLSRGLFRVASERRQETKAQQARVENLIRAYRFRGHVIANVDPLGMRKTEHPELSLEYHGLSEADLNVPFACGGLHESGVLKLGQIIERLDNTYCRSIGAQYMHIDDLGVKGWLMARMESSQNRCSLGREEQLRILTKLTDAEVFETFLHKKFVGAKRFSLEGGESLIPLLDMAIESASEHGVQEIVIGMAHRGRLNVLCNIMEKDAAKIFEEFADKDGEKLLGRGDVKYHLGHSSDRMTQTGKNMHLSLCFNPSHLAFVAPVVMGRVRSKQDRLKDVERQKIMGIVIHGDAAFSGQGVIQETLNMSGLAGYETGGTLHIILNNQIGFTTMPDESRSSEYATDVAKMLDVPIFHVNGEDPEGVAQTIQLAMEFKRKFSRDVIIDMYCYRKHGHNEGDEPSFTQPEMYKWVRQKPTVREQYLKNLVSMGEVQTEDGIAITKARQQDLEQALSAARAGINEETENKRGLWAAFCGGKDSAVPEAKTGISAAQLSSWLSEISTVPENFNIHPKIRRLLDQRKAMAEGERPLDWGAGEALAFASIMSEGAVVRLSGQDCERGTFSHRHSVLHDQQTGASHCPLASISTSRAKFDVHNSPLSETGVLGFDFGYSLDYPDGLVIWEAQFGDFANGGQVIIDQFITSCEEKWNRFSGLVMLLPHGFEGQGPEHSSARLERYLLLAADDNIQVMNLTTPSQLFHCLRRQVHRPIRKPTVIMSPKSLLRSKHATSTLQDLAEDNFKKVIADPTNPDKKSLKRVLFCSGKLYYALAAEREKQNISNIALHRIEQLYPIPVDEMLAAIEGVPEEIPVCWAQEEPVNMGAWWHLNMRLANRAHRPRFFDEVFARPESSSPASGSHAAHVIEQRTLVEKALDLNPS